MAAVGPSDGHADAAALAAVEAKIGEHCESVTWVTTGVFTLSIFLSILRPDPTLTICLFGFYGAHVRSAGAIRTFWFFMLVSIFVDLLWLFVYSPLRPIAFDTILALSRKDQLALLLSVLNTAYKVLVVWTGVSLSICFTKREALLEQMELDAGVGRVGTSPPGTTSSGDPLDARSLSAQVAR